MSINLAINGFGRIGRNVLRQIYKTGQDKDVKVVAINDLTDAKTLAHLLKYDSVHRKFDADIKAEENALVVNGNKIQIFSETDPANLPWKSLNIDVVMECTGRFTKRADAAKHLEAGARKVIISAPAKEPDLTIVYGVNHKQYDASKHNVISNASCTTNCLAPVAKVLSEKFGIVRGTMTTVHAYTNDQRILDLPHKDLRRARAAAMSMIPTTTGAAKAVALVLPELEGKIDGFAMRVPTADVSVVDLVCEIEKDATAEEINAALKEAANGELKGILGYCEEPLVSIDFTGCSNSSTVDSLCTMVIGKKLVKVVAWYDNEMGFSTRMVDVCKLIA
ncbi:MAG: type I glyceraldehyde-3-phosphate dehydrogenase [Bdellovibrionota bacterium]|nr:type I glyceraldehyde-3-phosphate dehydrogenase [Pseudomonadota bacterium]MDY6091460.1 type I glyceraldehyde-3-phosphate dehydrogenase [Bdellovibrionota bacterium]